MVFTPITIRDYVRLFVKSNRGQSAKEVAARLQKTLDAYKAGARCHCGEPIWVIGSAEAGQACFTCITGEADPSHDYEISEACDKYSVRPTVRSSQEKPGSLQSRYGDNAPNSPC